MAVYLYTFFPALLLIAIIRIDAKFIGPYFAIGELLPSFGGRESAHFYAKGTLRFALVRRLAYPIIMGVIYAIVGSNITLALLGGLVTGFLLVWPAWIAPNPPIGVSTRDALYHIFYLLVLLSAGALTLLGFYLVEAITYLSDGEPLRYLADNFFVGLLSLAVSLVFPAFTLGVGKSLSEKAHRRTQIYEDDYSEDYKWGT